MPHWLRTRAPYITLAAATITIGLAVQWRGAQLGQAARDVLGDALWAVMMTWWVATLAPAVRITVRAAVALAIAFAVETSQLYHTPALDALRATTAGHLVHGSGFDPRDLVAYTLGVLAAALLDRLAVRPNAETSRVSLREGV